MYITNEQTRSIFANNLTILKDTYNLTFASLSKLLLINSSSTVNEWVRSKRNFPKEGTLILISNIFGISIDWLLGRLSTPYLEPLLGPLETEILEYWNDTSFSIPDTYLDVEKRRTNYSLGVRANINFIVHSSILISLKEVIDNEYPILSKIPFTFFQPDYNKSYPKFLEILDTHLNDSKNELHTLLVEETKTPLFDLEAAIKKNKNT